MTATNLAYDILIKNQQLPEATQFVDRHPNQSFVLDHLAKPDILNGELAPWCKDISELARRPNVTSKLSRMVTEANWRMWTVDDLQTYFETVFEAFTPNRIMAGTDWPVLRVACHYKQWWQVIEQWIAPLSPTERAEIEGNGAARIYHST